MANGIEVFDPVLKQNYYESKSMFRQTLGPEEIIYVFRHYKLGRFEVTKVGNEGTWKISAIGFMVYLERRSSSMSQYAARSIFDDFIKNYDKYKKANQL